MDRWAAGSQQKSALNLLCMLCEHAGGSFRASVKKSGVWPPCWACTEWCCQVYWMPRWSYTRATVGSLTPCVMLQMNADECMLMDECMSMGIDECMLMSAC